MHNVGLQMFDYWFASSLRMANMMGGGGGGGGGAGPGPGAPEGPAGMANLLQA